MTRASNSERRNQPLVTHWRLDRLTAAALFLATAAFTLYQNTRVAVLWDLSFLLDTAYRFTLHQLPYRTLPFPYAPLTFLLHAALIEIFGRMYFPHILLAALEGGLATVLAWRILLKVLKPLAEHAWMIALLLTAPLTVLGIYSIYPHPIYDSDCILAVLLALYLLQRAAQSPIRNAIAGAACVLPLFFKQNIGLLFLLVTLAVVAATAIARRLHKQSLRPQLWFTIGALGALTLAVLTIQATVGLYNYLYWTITFAAHRRLPGIATVLAMYRQQSLLWSIPAVALALLLLNRSRPAGLSIPPHRRILDGVALSLIAAPFLWTILSLALTSDPSDRASQLLSLWPHLLILSAVLALWPLGPTAWRGLSSFNNFLPLILLATIHGTFLSQQLWGSTYAIWPLLTLLIAMLLVEVPSIARPEAAIIATTFLLCGGLYATSHDRLSYIQLDGPPTHATLPALRGLISPGQAIPDFEELVRVTASEIPPSDGILLIPGEVPFFFATGRTPQFPILLFDPATDPYSPAQTVEQARAHDIRWLIVTRNLQLNADPHPDLPAITEALKPDFTLYRRITNYDIYRRR